jgi:excisionase family DNA binding protein
MSDLLTVADTARLLNLSESGVKKMIAEGRLPAQKVGRDWVIEAAALPAAILLPRGRPRKPTP